MIDIAGELAARRGARFEDYTEAIRSLRADIRFSPALVDQLVPLAGFRNIVIHEYVALDMARVIAAVDNLEAVEQFVRIGSQIEADADLA